MKSNRSKKVRLGNNKSDVESFPYYGGLKGHSLNVSKDGKINAVVLLNPTYAEGRGTSDIHFNKIQETAARLVAIQDLAKKKGGFSEDDNKSYADSLLELGVAAQSLAQLQQTGDIKDFSKLLQAGNSYVKPEPANQIPLRPIIGEPIENENVAPVQNDPYDDFGDSISVNAPKKDASVAEAKPVGLSIVGEGGVASSKPNAIAVAGREGLAVASPKATAIAGVSPEEAAAYNVDLPTRNDIIIKAQQLKQQENNSHDILENYRFPLMRDTYGRLENEFQNRRSALMNDGDFNFLLIQPRVSNTNGRQPAMKSNSLIEPKVLRFDHSNSNSGEKEVAYNVALVNHFKANPYGSYKH